MYQMASRKRQFDQVANGVRNRASAQLQLLPKSAVDFASQPLRGRPQDLLRRVDFHPAITLLTGVAIVALISVIYLSRVTAVTNANYTLQALERDHNELIRTRGNLQLNIARSQSLPSIERIARERLKMLPLDDKYSYLSVSNGPITALPPVQVQPTADSSATIGGAP